MPAAVPFLCGVSIDKPHVGLVHERCGLQGMPRLLLRDSSRREFSQLIVNQRQQLLGRPGIAGFNGGQDMSHVGHEPEHTARGSGSQPAGGRYEPLSIVVENRADAATLREQGVAAIAEQVQVECLVGLLLAVAVDNDGDRLGHGTGRESQSDGASYYRLTRGWEQLISIPAADACHQPPESFGKTDAPIDIGMTTTTSLTITVLVAKSVVTESLA